MRLALLLTLALHALTLAADTSPCVGSRIYSGAYRHSILDVAIDAQRLWAATSHGITLYDAATDPPTPIASLQLPGTTSRVRVASGNAFVASGSELYVMRETAGEINVVGSVETNASINDLLIVGNYIYAATSRGVLQIDAIVPTAPLVTAHLATTSGIALSVTRFESTLFAADGDSSVEMFSIQVPAFPQRLGTFAGLPQSTSARVAGLNLLVSDGQQTQLYTVSNPPVKIGKPINVPSSTLVPYGGSVAFVAGDDRSVRAIDVSSTPSVVFSAHLPASSGGTINRIGGIATAPGRLYVAAGDMGLATFDTTSFQPPYPQRAVALGSFTSLARTMNGIVVTPATGGLTFYSVAANSDLPLAGPTWEASKTWTLHDVASTTVVASSGRTLSAWDMSTGTATAAGTATFPHDIVGAVVSGTKVYAIVESDTARTVWQADLTTTTAPAQLNAGVVAPYVISRSGAAIAIAELTEAGKSVISYWSSGDLSTTPVRVEVDGAATTGLAISLDGRAAVATFKGITIISFPNGTTKLIPNLPPGRDIEFHGDRLLFATEAGIMEFDAATATFTGTWSGVSPRRLQIGTSGGDAFYSVTEEGVASIRPGALAKLPQPFEIISANRYYRDLAVGGGHLLLADGASIDVFATRMNGAPSFLSRLVLPFRPVSIAVDDRFVYALSASGRVVAFSFGGAEQRSVALDEGADASFQQMKMVAGALHVSVFRGCSAGACEKKTLVFDASTLAQTSVYRGGLVDAVVEGATAWLLVDLPAEVRKVSLADPLRPSLLAAQPITDAQTPVAIARSSVHGVVYVLGTRLTAYDENALAVTGEMLTAYEEDPSRRVGYLDQRLSISGSCIVISGREFSPQVATLDTPVTLSPVLSLDVPAAAKRMVAVNGVTYVLTDYSLEVYSTQPQPKRRRPVN